MGNCCENQERQEFSDTLEYHKVNSINIKRRNYLGKIVGSSKVTFQNTSPKNINSLSCQLGHKFLHVWGCVLPGLDPRGELDKECQDSYTFIHQNNSLLCALFDGHGKEGQKVAIFCTNFVEKFFKKYANDFSEAPEETLTRLLHKCDEKLKRSRIPNEMAGSTAVVVYITEGHIHSASLGDSRAIISTLSDEMVQLPALSHNFHKKVSVKRNLKAVPLTTDQKPNHEEEFARIKAAGGSVEQVTDNFGKPVGPYRVWIPGKDLPGLAMSRSIGDRIAKRVGVIASPVCHTFSLFEADSFVVIASDGVWDVMENIEVVNFIECVKKKCRESSELYPATPDNSSIARMLCEEARYRWYGIIEDEDVMIDDISCIVVEFDGGPGDVKVRAKERNVVAFQSLAIANEGNLSINEDDTDISEGLKF